MSTANLNVWITEVGNPCKIDMHYQWFVHVLNCDGSVLNWCNRRYSNIETRCGHVEIEIPPGQYMVCATWSPGAPSPHPSSLGNHISHLQIVRANCADHICLTLFPPTFHWCGIWWLRALADHAELGTVTRERVDQATEAVQAVLDEVPMDPFTEAMQQIIAPPLTLELSFEPTTVVGRGESSQGTITLDPAPSNDAEVSLSSDNPDLFPDLPQSVIIPGGQSSSTFEVHTPGPATGNEGRARITASFAGASDTVELTVVVIG